MKPTIPELLDKLTAHGSTQQIALALQERGIQAEIKEPDRCAVAQYLQQERPDLEAIKVGLWCSWRNGPKPRVTALVSWTDDGADETATSSELIGEFVCNFDLGKYPELLAEEEMCEASTGDHVVATGV